MTETPIMRSILVAVSALPDGIFWRHNTGSLPTKFGRVSFGVIGSPDIIGAYHGRAIGIEVKTETGALRKSQKRFRAAFERAGGLYIVARSTDDALSALSHV